MNGQEFYDLFKRALASLDLSWADKKEVEITFHIDPKITFTNPKTGESFSKEFPLFEDEGEGK